ncbi:YybH family protein [Vampirovibrio chlorellavorus]|uniref:YybH family protein n=1 Tax=Vampirovibrio chlorellavorus TaxID=758823 RepID=UPI0026EF88E0|nr:SgcJ/EcaC family oxidoreductase [Vampirovibrio chlorellavorus]
MAKPFENHPIYSLMQTWHQASTLGDLDTIGSLMAEDAVFLVADHPPITRDDFLNSFSAIRQSVQLQIVDWRIEAMEESGHLAYCQSYLHLTITPKGSAQAIERKGPVLSVFRKEPTGQWVLIRDANFLSTEDSSTVDG